MPGSIRENDAFVRNFVIRNGISLVLDIGPGQGTYSDLLRGTHIAAIDAVEAWEPYIEQYGLKNKYDILWLEDVRDWMRVHAYEVRDPGDRYDLIIFGDVLEHVSEEEALTCWEAAGKIATWGLISVPIVHYPQGAEGGNPYEVHVQEHLTPEKVRELFGPFDLEETYQWTGTFIKRFS